MKNNLIIRLSIIVLVSVQVAWYIFLWVSYFNSPALLKGSDFRAFYTAGVIANRYGYEKVYDIDLEKITQETIIEENIPRGELLTYNHPPLLLPILALVSNFDYSRAYIIYGLFLLILTLPTIFFLYKVLKIKNWSANDIWRVLVAVLLFEPLFISILKGQDSALLLLGLVVWFTGLLKGEDRLSGLGLALTTIRPQISIFLAIPFIFQKRRVFTWYLLGGGVLVLYSYLMVGKQGFHDLLNLVRIGSAGQDYGLNLSAMFNLTGLILRVFPGVEPIFLNYLKWGFYGLALLGMILLWRQSSKIQNRHLVLLVISSVFFSPHMHYHDLAVMLVPILAMLLIWIDQAVISAKMAGLVIFIMSISLIFGDIFTTTYHIIPSLIMALILAGSWRPQWCKPRQKSA